LQDAPTEKTWLAEMSEGVDVLSKRGTATQAEISDKEDVEENETESENEEDKSQKLKTR